MHAHVDSSCCEAIWVVFLVALLSSSEVLFLWLTTVSPGSFVCSTYFVRSSELLFVDESELMEDA